MNRDQAVELIGEAACRAAEELVASAPPPPSPELLADLAVLLDTTTTSRTAETRWSKTNCFNSPHRQSRDATMTAMAMDSDDLNSAAETVSRAITNGLVGPDVNILHTESGQGNHVAGGLFAVAAAIEKLAEAIEAAADKD